MSSMIFIGAAFMAGVGIAFTISLAPSHPVPLIVPAALAVLLGVMVGLVFRTTLTP